LSWLPFINVAQHVIDEKFGAVLIIFYQPLNAHVLTLSHQYMKRTKVAIPWQEGLHLRPATRLVRLAQASKSLVLLKVGEKIADARSILAIMLLCASVGTVVDLEVSGEDEDHVIDSISGIFTPEPGQEAPFQAPSSSLKV
jgi:phosphotransferase system HPr (HPr) family protein